MVDLKKTIQTLDETIAFYQKEADRYGNEYVRTTKRIDRDSALKYQGYVKGLEAFRKKI